jgi:NADP-dependent 3-hydroxy acid dehydrogenase YdfG
MPTALVIGARNLGFAVIQRLLTDGWTVAGAARSAETLAKVRGAGAEPLEVDVTDQGSVLAALRQLGERHGRVDLAVNAASPYGGGRSGPFGGGPLAQAAATGFEDWAAMPARGAFGVRALTQAAALELREQEIHVALLIVDAVIDRSGGDDAGTADPASLADAVLYLAGQSPRAMTHELQVTPARDNWTP